MQYAGIEDDIHGIALGRVLKDNFARTEFDLQLEPHDPRVILIAVYLLDANKRDLSPDAITVEVQEGVASDFEGSVLMFAHLIYLDYLVLERVSEGLSTIGGFENVLHEALSVLARRADVSAGCEIRLVFHAQLSKDGPLTPSCLSLSTTCRESHQDGSLIAFGGQGDVLNIVQKFLILHDATGGVDVQNGVIRKLNDALLAFSLSIDLGDSVGLRNVGFGFFRQIDLGGLEPLAKGLPLVVLVNLREELFGNESTEEEHHHVVHTGGMNQMDFADAFLGLQRDSLLHCREESVRLEELALDFVDVDPTHVDDEADLGGRRGMSLDELQRVVEECFELLSQIDLAHGDVEGSVASFVCSAQVDEVGGSERRRARFVHTALN